MTRSLTRTIQLAPRLFLWLEFKPQDCWVGVYWARDVAPMATIVDVWICLVPMLPIHIRHIDEETWTP